MKPKYGDITPPDEDDIIEERRETPGGKLFVKSGGENSFEEMEKSAHIVVFASWTRDNWKERIVREKLTPVIATQISGIDPAMMLLVVKALLIAKGEQIKDNIITVKREAPPSEEKIEILLNLLELQSMYTKVLEQVSKGILDE